MTDLLILGSDTGVGKTTFCSLWLTAFADLFEYWKPLETGDSDTESIARLVPEATPHPPLKRFTQPVAPLLAARRERDCIPDVAAIVGARPRPQRTGLLVETFGSPFSPLDENDLQITLVRALGMPSILVSSTSLGTIGRTLQCLTSLASHGIEPLAVVLLGHADPFAAEQIQKHGGRPVYSLEFPASWDREGVQLAARQQAEILNEIRELGGRTGWPGLSLRSPGFCSTTGRRGFEDSARATPTSLQERDRVAIWHPYTSLREPDLPLPCVGAQDEFLFLEDGRRIIDGISSWWTILHGHRHPALMKALRDAAAEIDHVLFAGVTHPWAVELAEMMLASMPWEGGKVFYSDNGSTAVEVALKMAYQFWCHRGEPGRTRFIGFDGGYHGDTFGAMAVSRDPVFFSRFEPLLFQADIVPLDPDRLEETLRKRPGETAAVIKEPLVQGAGGMRMHAPELLRDLAQVALDHDVLFIADEVMTGGYRTGTLWAYQAAGIVPDLICAGKTLGGGVLPLAATLVSPRVVEAFDSGDPSRTFFHGHSFTAHPLACAVAVANWKLYQGGLDKVVADMEGFWQASLAPLRDCQQVRDVRIRGTIAAVELDVPGGYLAGVGRTLRRACLDRDVFLRPLGSVLYAMPPLCTSRASLEAIASAMAAACGASF